MRPLAVLSVLVCLASPHVAAAQRGRGLTDLGALHQACRSAEREGTSQRLYSIVIEPRDYSFAPYDAEEGVLWLDPRQRLRAMAGAVQVLPTGLEPIGFTASAARARVLREARGRGAKLRVGFFLGFDGRRGTLCLIRPASGVTTARIDVAYIELLEANGSVLAREDSERLRAYLDDPERQRVPGEGPRGVVGEPTAQRGTRSVPEPWRAALARPAPPIADGIARCYGAALERGAARDGQVMVRLSVDAATGRVAASEVELANLGDAEGASCVAGVFARALTLPPAGGSGVLELRVPVRLVSD